MKGMAVTNRSAHPAKAGHGAGVITAIELKTTIITIKHGQIQAMGWPAMTMTFKANPPVPLKGVHVGQWVRSDVRAQGIISDVTALRPDA